MAMSFVYFISPVYSSTSTPTEGRCGNRCGANADTACALREIHA